MRYAVNRAIYGFRREKMHEYNIAKAEGFYIAFFLKISLQTQFAISLVPADNEILYFRKVLTILKVCTYYYNLQKLKVSFFHYIEKRRLLPYEVSPFERLFF